MNALTTLLRAACLTGMLAGPSFAADAPDCTDFTDNDRMSSHDQRWCHALAFRASYMKGGKFVEAAPGSRGTARGVGGKLYSRFSSFGTSEVSGTITLDQLKGQFRLQLASTKDTLYYGRKIQVSGTISSGEGPVEVYSYVDVDLWKTAAVLVDKPVRNAPPPQDGLILKGYVVTEIPEGGEHPFTANLIALGGDFFLLLRAPDGIARDIRIEMDDP